MKGVIAGSLRRFGLQIRETYHTFESNGIDVCFPVNKQIADVKDGFPIFEGDPPGASVRQLEDGYLNAIDQAEFLYVVNPGGYIGTGTIFEIGYAHGRGKEIFASGKAADIIGQYLRGIFEPAEFIKFLRRERSLK